MRARRSSRAVVTPQASPDPATTAWVPIWNMGTGVVPDTAWHVIGAAGEPPFQNGYTAWGAGSTPPRFRKLSSGLVIAGGILRTPGAQTGAAAFTFPVGYRIGSSSSDFSIPVVSSAGMVFVNVVPSGTLGIAIAGVPPWPTNTWVYLDGVVFYAEG